MFRQVAVLYYTGHIVYAIAIHTKVKPCSYIHALRYATFSLLVPQIFPTFPGEFKSAVWSLGAGLTVSTTWSTGNNRIGISTLWLWIVPTSLQISFQEQLSRDHWLPRNSRLGDIKHKVKVTETHFSPLILIVINSNQTGVSRVSSLHGANTHGCFWHRL